MLAVELEWEWVFGLVPSWCYVLEAYFVLLTQRIYQFVRIRIIISCIDIALLVPVCLVLKDGFVRVTFVR